MTAPTPAGTPADPTGTPAGDAAPPASGRPAQRPVRIWQLKDWTHPVPPVRREVRRAAPTDQDATERPPLLFVPDARQADGAAVFVDPWLGRAAERGYLAAAVSPRGRGGTGRPGGRRGVRLREWVHDVVQEAAALPRRAVLVGYGTGALVVAHALARYPAAAGVLISPVGLPGARRGWLGVWTRAPRIGRAALYGGAPDLPPLELPVLVAAAAGDRRLPGQTLDSLAVRYGGRSARLPGAGSPLAATEPLDAVLDWLAGQA